MQIDVHSHGVPLSADGRAACEGRAAAALAGLPVARAMLFLADENGPKGGIDKACTVLVRLAGGGVVTAARRAAGVAAAVADAVEAAAAAARRRVDRRREWARAEGFA